MASDGKSWSAANFFRMWSQKDWSLFLIMLLRRNRIIHSSNGSHRPEIPRKIIGVIMELDIAWMEGVLPMANLYLVAIELGSNSGYYAFSYWDGEKWSQAYPEKIIAFYPANQFIDQFKIKWPKPDSARVDDDSDIPASMTDGDWEQVC